MPLVLTLAIRSKASGSTSKISSTWAMLALVGEHIQTGQGIGALGDHALDVAGLDTSPVTLTARWQRLSCRCYPVRPELR